ncbi:hypothetical protein KNO81_33600 [Paraburkholderia sediminicola]|nr:hypothetical protein [Paraburkholderia sediminicola]
MTKAEKRPALTPAQVVECMTPGTLYSLAQIARLMGTGPPEALRMLSACVAKGTVKESRDGRRVVYRLRTEEDIQSERERVVQNTLPKGVLRSIAASAKCAWPAAGQCRATRTATPSRMTERIEQTILVARASVGSSTTAQF